MGKKRTFAQLRDDIMAALAQRPMNTHELKIKTNISGATIKRHMAHLVAIGVVKEVIYRKRKGGLPLWTLSKEE